jgi:L-fuconolactonase
MAMTSASAVLAKPPQVMPAIDTHIHLFDTRRPQGVPWPPKEDAILYRPALPPRYRQITAGLGIVGAIEVECSPWFEDNQWVLDVAAQDSIMVGTVGNIDPSLANFGTRLEQLHRNPLFRGIRHGNLWGRSLAQGVSQSTIVSNLKLLADAGLALDTANPDPPLLAAVVRLTDQIPSLRVVIDHFPVMGPVQDGKLRAAIRPSLLEIGKRPQVFVKVSEVLHPINGHVHGELDFYRPWLDEIWEVFGTSRVLYGSDWPNSDDSAPLRQEWNLVRDYVHSKGTDAAEKYFWKNSVAAYRWVKRSPDQPNLRAS